MARQSTDETRVETVTGWIETGWPRSSRQPRPPDLRGLPHAGGIDWDQADAFCKWRGARLPTEVEWEKAARGPDGARYPWGDGEPPCARANVRIPEGACAPTRHVEPRRGPPGGRLAVYGVIGMAGNVQEWTSDWLSQDYSALSARESVGPAGADAQFPTYKIVRGAYFDMGPRRVSWRSFAPKTVRSVGRIGFRCASSSAPPRLLGGGNEARWSRRETALEVANQPSTEILEKGAPTPILYVARRTTTDSASIGGDPVSNPMRRKGLPRTMRSASSGTGRAP